MHGDTCIARRFFLLEVCPFRSFLTFVSYSFFRILCVCVCGRLQGAARRLSPHRASSPASVKPSGRLLLSLRDSLLWPPSRSNPRLLPPPPPLQRQEEEEEGEGRRGSSGIEREEACDRLPRASFNMPCSTSPFTLSPIFSPMPTKNSSRPPPLSSVLSLKRG